MIINSDNINALKTYPDNYFDSVVTDPPYGLGKEPDAVEVMTVWATTGYHEIKGTGFMGKEWDAFVPQPLFWKEVFRVLKPGGHCLAFYGTRTYDWGVMAMRFAGFEVRDCIQWLYGSGFPKSHNISKALDGTLGKQGKGFISAGNDGRKAEFNQDLSKRSDYGYVYEPATKNAKLWDGWGSALKPANEPIVLARKPLEKGLSIAENVLKWGVGGINIDGCRVEGKKEWGSGHINFAQKHSERDEEAKRLSYDRKEKENQGRFPANIILTHHPECECKGLKKVKAIKGGSGEATMKSGMGKNGIYGKYSHNKLGENVGGLGDENGQETVEDWNCHPDCPIKLLDEQSGEGKSVKSKRGNGIGIGFNGSNNEHNTERGHSDKGGASRFFYVAKASKSERNNGLEGFEEKESKKFDGGKFYLGSNVATNRVSSNFHPTVKPIKLMQYLVRLITPPNGIVLDPFCGSGTTGIACKLEGFEFVGIEQDAEYCKIAEARIKSIKKDLTLF